MTDTQALFSFRGRLSRSGYWLGLLLVWPIATTILNYAAFFHAKDAIGLIISVVLLWPIMALNVKRLHDRNRSGWYVLITLIPIIGILWLIGVIWFPKGTDGPNRFGDEPGYVLELRSTFWLLALSIVLAAMCAVLVLWGTPVEMTMGPVQKLFYLHLPSAINTFLACMVCFIASIGYLMQRQSLWDDMASAAAKVAVLFCSVVLATGMIWGHSAWGQWWTWSPRLTFSLVLWLLYVVYLMIRASIESQERRAIIAAVYGIIVFLDVPLVYLSVRLMPDIHPLSVQLPLAMKHTLMVCFIPVTIATVCMITILFSRNRAAVIRNEQLEQSGIA